MKQLENNQQDRTYMTNDLSLSCTLLCLNFTLQKLDIGDQRKVGFVFIDSDELQNAIKSYWDNHLTVNPREYFNTLKDLKSRIYSQRYA